MLADGIGAPARCRICSGTSPIAGTAGDRLRRAKGESIPLPMRIVHLAVDASFQRLLGGEERVVRLVRERAGHAFDPEVAACLSEDAEAILAVEGGESAWDETLACEPEPRLSLEGEALERALAAMGNFADLISPSLTGHSTGVAELAPPRRRAAGSTRRASPRFGAALVHDLGRVAVHPRIWEKRGPLSADEREQVRLHPYHSERVLARSEFLAALAPIAGAHHERLDGSGYHRGAGGGARAPRAPACGGRRLPRHDRAAPVPGGDRARAGG